MSILVTAIGEVCLLFLLRWLRIRGQVRKVALISITIYLIGVFIVTFGHRTSDSAGDTNLILFSTFSRMFSPTLHRIQEWRFPRGLRELKWIGYKSWESVILNLLMLVPLGYLLPLCFEKVKKCWKVGLIGFLFSFSIETAQLLFHRGWFDVDDIFLNTVGVLIGYGLYCVLLKRKTGSA